MILFDNRGIESSAGQTPDSVQAMATDALAFVDALGLKQIDLLGFSLGGMVAQQMVLDRPELVRHLILAGTGPEEGGEGIDIGRHAEFGTPSRFKPAGKHAAIRHPVTLVSGSGSR